MDCAHSSEWILPRQAELRWRVHLPLHQETDNKTRIYPIEIDPCYWRGQFNVQDCKTEGIIGPISPIETADETRKSPLKIGVSSSPLSPGQI
jgi:hypothetical protein